MTQETELVPAHLLLMEDGVTVAGMLNIVPADTALIATVIAFAEQAQTVVVADAQSCEGAEGALREIRTLDKQLDANRIERTKPLNDAKNDIIAAYKPAEDALKKADYAVTQAVTKWRREQEMKRRQAEQEAAAKAEKARQAALAKADEYREKGREDKAEQWEDKAIYTPTPVVASAAPKTQGVNYRTVWHWKLREGGKAKLPMNLLMVNETAIGALVNSLHEEHGLDDAIEVWSEEVPVTRRIS